MVLGDVLVSDDLLLLHQEIEHSVHDCPLDAEDLGCLVPLDDALLHRLADDRLLYDHVLLVVDVEPPAQLLLFLRQVGRTLLRLLDHQVLTQPPRLALSHTPSTLSSSRLRDFSSLRFPFSISSSA